MAAPYLTPQELVNAPTGIDWSSIPARGATQAQQLIAQKSLINDATSWVDGEVQQGFAPVPGFTLSATTQTETIALVSAGGRRARFLGDGTFRLFLTFLPIISVSVISYSPDGVNFSTLAGWALPGNKPEGRSVLRVVPPGSWAWSFGGFGAGSPSYGWLQVTDVAGFPNTTLAAPAAVSDTTLSIVDVTGIEPGDVLTIYDMPDRFEALTVASSWSRSTGAGVVPVTSAVVYAHAAAMAVASMPQQLRVATRLKVVDLVRERGADAVTIGSAGRGRPMLARGQAPQTTEQKAKDALQPFKRTI